MFKNTTMTLDPQARRGRHAAHPAARSPTALAIAGLLAVALVTPGAASAQSRGQLLYEAHCIACHTTQMHWRERRLATDPRSLRAQVRRWQGNASLNWTDEDIDDVVRYLDQRYYRFEGGAPPDAASRQPTAVTAHAASTAATAARSAR